MHQLVLDISAPAAPDFDNYVAGPNAEALASVKRFAAVALREDLRTRLAWGLVYQLKPLSDADKARHLHAQAARRGLRLPDEVVGYLLTRLPRDLASLNAVLEALDRYSLSAKRPVTLPLVREALERKFP